MANYDYIFVAAGKPPAEVASLMGESVELEAGVNPHDVPFVARQGLHNDKVFATIETNDLGGPDPLEPDDIAAFAGYDTILQIWTRPKDSDNQRTEARRLFDDLIGGLPNWPALLTHNLEIIVAVWSDGRLTEFPEPLSSYGSGRSVWGPLVVPYRASQGS